MTLDSTTDSIEIILAAAHTTRALQFYCSYNITDVSISSHIGTKNFGTTNGTTAVTIVPAPSSGKVNQLKFCSIYNCDSIEHTLTIRINSNSNMRTVLSTILKVGEQIQFVIEEGWKVFNMDGIFKTANAVIGSSAVKAAISNFNQQTTGNATTITSGTDYAYYLGKADRAYDTVTIQLNIPNAVGATITWAEAAIYKGYPSIGSNVTLTRCGWVDISSGSNHGVNATGAKTIVIPILDKNIFMGDEIWFVIGYVNTGGAGTIRVSPVPDNIGSGMIQSVAGSLRPSTNSSISFTLSSVSNQVTLAWQGTQNV